MTYIIKNILIRIYKILLCIINIKKIILYQKINKVDIIYKK